MPGEKGQGMETKLLLWGKAGWDTREGSGCWEGGGNQGIAPWDHVDAEDQADPEEEVEMQKPGKPKRNAQGQRQACAGNTELENLEME